MVANTVQSRKAKGRRHQQDVAAAILKTFPHLSPDDVLSRGMGGQGEDIMLSKAAREVLPVSIECKATESFNMHTAYNQAAKNAGDYTPIVIHRKNRTKPLVIVDLAYFLELHADCHKLALKVGAND